MPHSVDRLRLVEPLSGLWCRFVERLRDDSARRRAGSPDLHQAKMRFLVLAGSLAYMVSIGVLRDRLTLGQTLVFGLDALVFGLFALHTFAHFKRDPRPNRLLRTVGLFADHGAALTCLAVAGRDAGALAWLPLFIIQGVGIRFGIRWLFASQAIGLASIGIVCAVNPFFRDNFTVALGAVLSMLVLPIYIALLAHREAQIKAALDDARLSAEAANEAKGRFVAMISHELRTPLTGIAGLNELLSQQTLPEVARQLLVEQHAATALMLTMVNDVLDLSKVEAGEMKVQAVRFDPQELAVNILRALSFQAMQKGLVLRTELDASVPLGLSGSPFHVARILQNLLGNAIKFTAEGSVTLRMTCADASTGGATKILFEVIDTGIGIPEESLPKIFDRFYQVDAAVTRRFGGTGLGTSLVKEFCDLLQGSVRLESTLGKGTHCFVTLPFEPLPATDEPPLDVAGAAVAAWADDVADWPAVKAELLRAGVSVRELGDSSSTDSAVARSVDAATVLLIGSASSERALAVAAMPGLRDAACILLGDASRPGPRAVPASSRVVKGVRSTTLLANAVRLAGLGVHPGAVGSVVPAGRSKPASPGTPSGPSVLVAEDTPTIQLFIRATLEAAGFAVRVTGDGAEALDAAMHAPYDVIVLDWNMPKVDGIGVVRTLRSAAGPNALTPIIIATAAPSPQLVDQATAVGALAVLGKPFAGEALVRAVHAACAVSRAAPVVATDLVASPSEAGADGTLILDTEALDGADSIFKAVDPAKLIDVFMRDVAANKVLLNKAVATDDLGLLLSALHSLSGYAGVLGARRLEQLLANAPRDAAGLAARGAPVVAELCDTIDRTCAALDEWSQASLCGAQ